MIKCTKCGTENKNSAKFCKGCGSSLEKTGTSIPGADIGIGAPSIKSRPLTSQRVLSVAETGEVLEKVDRAADEEGIHILSNTFAETLTQLAKSREELGRIEERVAEALMIQREKEEKKLQEISASYELTQQKIRALEELSALRRLAAGERKLAAIFRGESVDIGDELFGEKKEEVEDELEDELEQDDLLEDELSSELPDDLDDEFEELDSDEDKVECGNCHSLIPEDATVCPVCGVQFED
jgi:RNA polymerase subunit RPABC4/transcription elongation factor Spt4